MSRDDDIGVRLSDLEKRISAIERRLGSPAKDHWSYQVIKTLVMLPVVALPTLFALDFFAGATGIPLVVLGLAAWCAVVVVWLLFELFVGDDFRFGLARLLFVILLFCVIFAGVQVYVLTPQRTEAKVLASIQGLNTHAIHRRPVGSRWLRYIIGDDHFQRVQQISIEPPGGDEEVPKIRDLELLSSILLTGPGFTDRCLNDLEGMPHITFVVLSRTLVTPEGVNALRQSRPDLEIQVQ